MKLKTELETIEHAAVTLDSIFSDSVKYPQLRMPDRQHERVKNLLHDLKSYLNKHPFRRVP